ncbi:MAG: tyrosine-type recombinase/integrase [Chloroflexota bacterium]
MPKTHGAKLPTVEELPDELRSCLQGFILTMESQNKSPRTIVAYTEAVRTLARYLKENKKPTDPRKITKPVLEGFFVDILKDYSAATANNRFRALQAFFSWAITEKEIRKNPMDNMKPPRVPDKPVPIIAEDDIVAMVHACDGTGFRARRDKAIILVFLDTGVRLEELTNLQIADIDIDKKRITVTGKGNKTRTVGIGTNVAAALNRYLRVRARHRHSELAELWLGPKGAITKSGISDIVDRIARSVGIKVHPHQLRHSKAHYYLLNGGQENDLRVNMGWESRAMIARYANSTAQERAIGAHRTLSPADNILKRSPRRNGSRG